MSAKRSSILCILVLVLAAAAPAQLAPNDPHGHPWWQHAVLYEIYPRSFADSNNDGVGDLNGITSHLDYLKKLGVDAIWITPCYPSPQVDFGYDVSDYENIDPQYGTMADFDRLVAEAQKRGIRVIMDLVLNHTSDQHPWFLDSRSSRTSAHRDWYVWEDGKTQTANGRGLTAAQPDVSSRRPPPAGGNIAQPPNNWLSLFGGSAWQWDPRTQQFYLHQFYVQQPDLNWRNPAVKQAMFDVARFWYQRGVAGFRLDAVDRLFEAPDLRDNPVTTSADGEKQIEDVYTREQPGMHDVLRQLRSVSDQYHAVLVGETWTDDIAALKAYYGNGNELQLPMDFQFATINKLSAAQFREQIELVESACDQTPLDAPGRPPCIAWPVFLLSNHDMERGYDRYGDGVHNQQIAKLMAALYLTLRGTPLMYYGEEIGMENNDPTRVEDVKDPVGRRFWPKNKGRDGERTPMQWDASPNAGFSTAAPWLPVPPSYTTRNVASEQKDKHSILKFYRKLLELRRKKEPLSEGNFLLLNPDDPNVLAFLREYEGKAVLVALNLSAAPHTAAFQLPGYSAKAKKLVAEGARGGKWDAISLQPFGVFVGEVKKSR